MERHTVSVSVDNGMLVGLGCANLYHKGKLCGDSTRTYWGEALAVIRAQEPGTVRMIAADEQRQCEAAVICAMENG